MNGTTQTGDNVTVALNDYFTSVGNSRHDPNCLDYMCPRIEETALLFPVTADEVMPTIISLNNTTWCDVDGLNIRPRKYVAATIAKVLEHIINLIFSCGRFPRRFQVAKVITIYKVGDKYFPKLSKS